MSRVTKAAVLAYAAEHNPDEGEHFFCCGEPTHLNIGLLTHGAECWYVNLREALAAYRK